MVSAVPSVVSAVPVLVGSLAGLLSASLPVSESMAVPGEDGFLPTLLQQICRFLTQRDT